MYGAPSALTPGAYPPTMYYSPYPPPQPPPPPPPSHHELCYSPTTGYYTAAAKYSPSSAASLYAARRCLPPASSGGGSGADAFYGQDIYGGPGPGPGPGSGGGGGSGSTGPSSSSAGGSSSYQQQAQANGGGSAGASSSSSVVQQQQLQQQQAMIDASTYTPPPPPSLMDPYAPSPHYYTPGYGPPPPACYSHSPTRSIPYPLGAATYQNCPCPMQSCPKNVHTGPLTGDCKRSAPMQIIAKGTLPPVALALPLEPASATGPPSPARGSAGMPPPPSPAGATYHSTPPAAAQQPSAHPPSSRHANGTTLDSRETSPALMADVTILVPPKCEVQDVDETRPVDNCHTKHGFTVAQQQHPQEQQQQLQPQQPQQHSSEESDSTEPKPEERRRKARVGKAMVRNSIQQNTMLLMCNPQSEQHVVAMTAVDIVVPSAVIKREVISPESTICEPAEKSLACDETIDHATVDDQLEEDPINNNNNKGVVTEQPVVLTDTAATIKLEQASAVISTPPTPASTPPTEEELEEHDQNDDVATQIAMDAEAAPEAVEVPEVREVDVPMMIEAEPPPTPVQSDNEQPPSPSPPPEPVTPPESEPSEEKAPSFVEETTVVDKPSDETVLEPCQKTVAENVKVKNMKRKLSISSATTNNNNNNVDKKTSESLSTASPPKKVKVANDETAVVTNGNGSYKDLIKKNCGTMRINNRRKLNTSGKLAQRVTSARHQKQKLVAAQQQRTVTNSASKSKRRSVALRADDKKINGLVRTSDANKRLKAAKPLSTNNGTLKQQSNSNKDTFSDTSLIENKEPPAAATIVSNTPSTSNKKTSSKIAAAKKPSVEPASTNVEPSVKTNVDRTIDSVVNQCSGSAERTDKPVFAVPTAPPPRAAATTRSGGAANRTAVTPTPTAKARSGSNAAGAQARASATSTALSTASTSSRSRKSSAGAASASRSRTAIGAAASVTVASTSATPAAPADGGASANLQAALELAKRIAAGTVTRRSLQSLRWSNGWTWEGAPFENKVSINSDETIVPRKCYPAMRHREGDKIELRDCVLLKAGPRKNDLPFVARVAALWENPDDGEMMMSLLWYYRPEHTEQGRTSADQYDEVFASRHRDANSVACIEDKCYVLTFSEYCRYRKTLKRLEEGIDDPGSIVPMVEPYPRQNRLPPPNVPTSPEMVFFCRRVYDFRQKRIIKNPS